MRINSRRKQIWASRTSGTGLLKSLLAATPTISIPSRSASCRSSWHLFFGQSAVAMRPLAINFHAVVAELFGGANEFRQSKGFAAIPAAEVGDAIESNFIIRFQSFEFSSSPEIELWTSAR